MSHLPGKFVWFEHQSSDIPKARKFYDALFGWHTESMPIGDQRYSMILNGDGTTSEGYRRLPQCRRPTQPRAGSPTRRCTDVDTSYTAALAAGAKGVTAPIDHRHGGPRRNASPTPRARRCACGRARRVTRPTPPRLPIGSLVLERALDHRRHARAGVLRQRVRL